MFFSVLKHFGPTWVAQRLWFKAERALGLLERRCPLQAWAEIPLPAEAAAQWRHRTPRLAIAQIERTYLAPHLAAFALEHGCSPVSEADLLAAGHFRIFNHALHPAGVRPAWHQSVLDGRTVDASQHWSRLTDHGSTDIKGVWELSRFAWVYPLVRAWVLEGDARHVERFWFLFEDWMAANPPNRGPQWMCGQEASLRLLAVAFALQAFRDHPATTAARLDLSARLATATAHRIKAHLAYAVSQQNNHGLSEALGLYTAGALWPQLAEAPSWRAQGLETLFPQVLALVAVDGGFSQHSTNYHRLFLQLMVWAEIVLRAEGEQLPHSVGVKVRLATEFLLNLMETDGTVPRYGADDSANLFPLAGGRAADFRPAVGAAQVLFLGHRQPAGPWDEAALLLVGPMPCSTPPAELPRTVDAVASGVAVLRHPRGTAFFRSPTQWRHRPSQADHHHVSLRWDGEWLTEDVGTYSYNAPDFAGDLAAAVSHNVATVNGCGPMHKASRFLWLPWTTTRRQPSALGFDSTFTDVAGNQCSRRVGRFPQGFVIIDRLRATSPTARCELRWHGSAQQRAGLEQLALACSAPSEETWTTADPATGTGYFSESYGQLAAGWTRCLTATGREVIFVTALGCAVVLHPTTIEVDGVSYPL